MAANEMIIARLPGRTGLYLGVVEGTTWRSIARFTRAEESAEEFMAWARRSGIRCEDDRKEAGDGLLRAQGEEARQRSGLAVGREDRRAGPPAGRCGPGAARPAGASGPGEPVREEREEGTLMDKETGGRT